MFDKLTKWEFSHYLETKDLIKHIRSPSARLGLFGKPRPLSHLNHLSPSMSSKRKKLALKRSRASEEPTCGYDHDKFAEKFGLISKNRSFIKEKGFHHLDVFFRKTIANKGWRKLFQPLSLAAISVV